MRRALPSTNPGPARQSPGHAPEGPRLAVLKPALAGIQRWDRLLAREQDRVLGDDERPIWRVIQSGQYHTAVQTTKGGVAQKGSCFLCGAQQQTWVHLWAECPGLSLQRRTFGPGRPKAPRGKDLRLLCQQILAEPHVLPPTMANFGIAIELGAAVVHRWWAKCEHPTDDLLMGVEAGAWHPSLHPEFDAIVLFRGATARQAVDNALGPVAPSPGPRRPG